MTVDHGDVNQMDGFRVKTPEEAEEIAAAIGDKVEVPYNIEPQAAQEDHNSELPALSASPKGTVGGG